METPQIRVKTEGFRAIAKADIIIDGITVVTGENGSGKSTLSKLLYYFYKTANNYDKLIAEELERNLKDVEQFLIIIQHDFQYPSKEQGRQEELRGIEKELSKLHRNNSIDEKQMKKWTSLIKLAADEYSLQLSAIEESKLRNSKAKRLRYIMYDIILKNPEIQGILSIDNLNEKEGFENLSLPFDKIIEIVELRFKEAIGKVKSRPTSVFLNVLLRHFQIGELPKVFEVLEYGEKIISLSDKKDLSIPYSMQNVIYIDTSVMIGEKDTDLEYWNDLNKLLRKKGNISFSDLSQIIKDIINGDVSFEDDAVTSVDFLFRRKDGLLLDLLDCATGIKSFAILQLLLKNGSLTDKTLLIIDEPESNLHPQWIIEYARLIVLLNKEIGMKFFIASHNPDMVSALKYISEKQKVEKKLNFYLAEKTKNEYLYRYKHLGTDIEPIFGSFNIAIERINKYGA